LIVQFGSSSRHAASLVNEAEDTRREPIKPHSTNPARLTCPSRRSNNRPASSIVIAAIACVDMNTQQSIEEAGRVWSRTVAEIPALKKRIRAEAEARIDAEINGQRSAAARAIHYALDHGATKRALHKVTTTDHWDFESYVDLGRALARDKDESGEGPSSGS